MKIRTDEHFSKFLAVSLRDIALTPGWELTSIHESGDVGADDVHWIRRFADEGGEGIISADSDFLLLEPQVNAVFETGMRVIHLPPKWGSARGYLQAAHIFQWWSRIENRLSNMKPRECYRPPWNINESGDLKKIPIDFARAQKKRKRRQRGVNKRSS